MDQQKSYKFVYLGNYVINGIFAIACLILYWTGADLPDLRDWSEMGVCFFGGWTLLNLWGPAFIARDDYSGKRILDARTTRAITSLLVIADLLILMNPLTGSMGYLKAATALTGLCLVILVYTICSGKLVKANLHSSMV